MQNRGDSIRADRIGPFPYSSGNMESHHLKELQRYPLISRRTLTVSMSPREQLQNIPQEGGLLASDKEIKEKPTEHGSTKPDTNEKLQTLVATVRQNWNDLVGYTDIEKQREKVETQGQIKTWSFHYLC